jgi:hypothetical protein
LTGTREPPDPRTKRTKGGKRRWKLEGSEEKESFSSNQTDSDKRAYWHLLIFELVTGVCVGMFGLELGFIFDAR